MMNRRSMLSALPAMAVRPQADERKPRKCVILLYDINTIDHGAARVIVQFAHDNGYEALCLGVDLWTSGETQEPIRVLDLSNLPPAEIEELRRLGAEKVQAISATYARKREAKQS